MLGSGAGALRAHLRPCLAGPWSSAPRLEGPWRTSAGPGPLPFGSREAGRCSVALVTLPNVRVFFSEVRKGSGGSFCGSGGGSRLMKVEDGAVCSGFSPPATSSASSGVQSGPPPTGCRKFPASLFGTCQSVWMCRWAYRIEFILGDLFMFRELIRPLGADVPLFTRERSLPPDVYGRTARLQQESRKAVAGRPVEKGREGGYRSFLFKHLN